MKEEEEKSDWALEPSGQFYRYGLYPISSSGSDDDLQVNALMIMGPRDALEEVGNDDLLVNTLMTGGPRDALVEVRNDDLPVNALVSGGLRDALVEAGDDDLPVNALMISGGGGKGTEIHWWRVGISTTLIFFLICEKNDNIKENVYKRSKKS